MKSKYPRRSSGQVKRLKKNKFRGSLVCKAHKGAVLTTFTQLKTNEIKSFVKVSISEKTSSARVVVDRLYNISENLYQRDYVEISHAIKSRAISSSEFKKKYAKFIE